MAADPANSDPVLFAASKAVLTAEHHQVLIPWSRLARKTGLKYHVISLDHHTDVLPSFQRSAKKGDFDFSTEEAVLKDLALLHHDEHFDWALRAGILGSALIVSEENFTPPAHPSLRISCDPVWPDPQSILNGTPEAIHAAEQVLESDYLSRQIGTIPHPLILDLDLDYFLCEKALHPRDDSFFRRLIAEAELITCSLETEWQKILRLPGETLDSKAVFSFLRKNFFGI